MAFGQQSGPPASARQVQQLSALVERAGHSDFRDARGPLGLSQRQAAGKFTRDEADELIERLEAELDGPGPDAPTDGGSDGGVDGGASASVAPPTASRPTARRREAPRVSGLDKVPSELLAAELQRRGWVVMEP